MNTLMFDFNKAKQDIYEHVGFKEDWGCLYPIDDRTGYFWKLTYENTSVRYAGLLSILNSEDMEYYEDKIYIQRFYKKHIYRGEELTLIFVGPYVDGNRFFVVFSNDLEIKEQEGE